jgi:hypothetical protein
MIIEIILPPSSMGNAMIIPWVWNICPVNDFNMVVDISILGELMDFQHDIDMIQVKAPSITIV